jgi:hypothetical protein
MLTRPAGEAMAITIDPARPVPQPTDETGRLRRTRG